MKEYYIYKIICLMDDWNGKFYIGKHYGKLDDNYTGSGKMIKEYLSKYGKIKGLTYDKQILEVGDENDICDLEREYIREGIKSELCLNLCCRSSGGALLGQKHSEETKQKLRKPKSEETKQKLRKPRSEETKRKMKLNHADVLGENNPMYGRKHSEESRKKMREAKKRQYQNKI